MGAQTERITVPLPPTLFDTRRSAEVELPMICSIPAVTPQFAAFPALFWTLTVMSVGLALTGKWFFGIYGALMGILAAAGTTQLIARLALGDQRLVIGEEGLLDTRYGPEPKPWRAFQSASLIYGKDKLGGVMMSYREPLAKLPPMLGYLAATGSPFGRRRNMLVELRSVRNKEVVAATIVFMVKRHTASQADSKRP